MVAHIGCISTFYVLKYWTDIASGSHRALNLYLGTLCDRSKAHRMRICKILQ